ncbi:hypothetical protein BC938DRAFT_481010 [Jimgerdemannia flammicorona]|uniref:Uncharacterized protein n=1 Tax=Jimgerdemannia flammicorona TaxID=994334 RepID=A0A433QH41_9FUNG|nr:hypothetical protein BC938DRAFT_481010 [Jimgerdemannia flammicorona]
MTPPKPIPPPRDRCNLYKLLPSRRLQPLVYCSPPLLPYATFVRILQAGKPGDFTPSHFQATLLPDILLPLHLRPLRPGFAPAPPPHQKYPHPPRVR